MPQGFDSSVCTWCNEDMTVATTCTVDAFHREGRRFAMIRLGSERGQFFDDQCDDCGVVRGGLHHPGCDLQVCPACGHQMLSCGCRFDEDGPVDEPFGVDGNGVLTERMVIDGVEVIIHRDEYPDSDLTTVRGIPCTTALRTVIDMATELAGPDLRLMFFDGLHRELFTLDEAQHRLSQPDMAQHRGAALVRAILPPHETGATRPG